MISINYQTTSYEGRYIHKRDTSYLRVAPLHHISSAYLLNGSMASAPKW